MSDYVDQVRKELIDYMAKSGESQSRISLVLGVSKTTVSMFINGVYTGDNNELATKAEQYIRMGTAKSRISKPPDICTDVYNTKQILEKTEIAHICNEILLIYGPAGCGKTTALQYYTQNHNGVIYIEADVTVNSPRAILRLILSEIGEDTRGTTSDIMKRLVSKLKGSERLIIIDEAQHLTEKSFDTIRAINDKAKVGLVYSGNPSVLKRMYGRKQDEFDQVFSRIVYKCHLNNNYSLEDIKSIYRSFNFSNECIKYLYTISKRKGGLRMMVNQCRIAQNLAAALNEALTVEHFEKAAIRMGIEKTGGIAS